MKAPLTCPVFLPDHNGECLTCDEWMDAHTPAAIAAGASLATRPDLAVGVRDLIAKLQYVIDYMDRQGLLPEHVFTFPDGDTWDTSGVEAIPPPPPPSPIVRQATDAEQRQAIVDWARTAVQQGAGHDCGEWPDPSGKCQLCGTQITGAPE